MTARHQYGEPAFGGEVQIVDFTDSLGQRRRIQPTSHTAPPKAATAAAAWSIVDERLSTSTPTRP
jgi:hypothetical protein